MSRFRKCSGTRFPDRRMIIFTGPTRAAIVASSQDVRTRTLRETDGMFYNLESQKVVSWDADQTMLLFLTGPNPTDRGKPGTKYHLVVATDGLPLGAVPSAASSAARSSTAVRGC
jgi:hypothetical protein